MIITLLVCPFCKNSVGAPITMYGQKSFECLRCNRWGPWKDVKRREVKR